MASKKPPRQGPLRGLPTRQRLRGFLLSRNARPPLPVATTIKPYIELDSFAFLEVKDVNRAGAFLDMGLIKQLLVPFSEQPVKMEVGER